MTGRLYEDNCGECRFYEELESICKRFPPQIVISSHNEYSAFPRVETNMLCGEFARKKLDSIS